METIKLATGYEMPVIGLGTWNSQPGEVGQAVKDALENGYKLLDCAQGYSNQKEVGEALQKVFDSGVVKREEIFITSKVWNTFHSYGRAMEAVDTILDDLKLKYIDLMLVHWPTGFEEGGEIFPKKEDGHMRYSDVDYMETYRALEDSMKAGKIRSIGISNFNHKQIQRVIDNCTIKPSVLQVEMHPYFRQAKLVEFCRERNIALTAYSPLSNPTMGFGFRKDSDPSALEEPIVKELCKKYNKTPAQVVLRWGIQRGTSVIPKSVHKDRIIENHQVFDFKLTDEDMKAIDQLDKNWRIVNLTKRDGDHPHFPFNDW